MRERERGKGKVHKLEEVRSNWKQNVKMSNNIFKWTKLSLATLQLANDWQKFGSSEILPGPMYMLPIKYYLDQILIGVFDMGAYFFYNWECENILKFGSRFEPIFSRILHSQKGKSTKKYSHSPHRNPTILWEENVCHNKKIKISLLPSKATRC